MAHFCFILQKSKIPLLSEYLINSLSFFLHLSKGVYFSWCFSLEADSRLVWHWINDSDPQKASKRVTDRQKVEDDFLPTSIGPRMPSPQQPFSSQICLSGNPIMDQSEEMSVKACPPERAGETCSYPTCIPLLLLPASAALHPHITGLGPSILRILHAGG